MIGYLSGLVIDIDLAKNALLVLAGQIGWRVVVSADLLSRVQADQKIQLFIHTAVREDDISLYGFAHKEEHVFFQQLISVSGIGPKLAMDVLAAPLAATQTAIAGGNADLLTKIKGIGKKTAERIVLELKGKVIPAFLNPAGTSGSAQHRDAVLALQSLGYDPMHIVKVLAGIPSDLSGTEAIVKYFLKQAV